MCKWKRFAAWLLTAALCGVLLTGCGGQTAETGFGLDVCVGGQPATFDPIYAEERGDQTILTHLYENLMRTVVDVSGAATVSYGMAKSVSQEDNHDGTVTYTFKLRSAKWSDGRSVRADDFVYAWRRLADPASRSPYASLLSVVAGYDEARTERDMSLLQVTAKNDTTLVVTLNGTYDWFLTDVCTSPATMPLREDVVQKLKAAAEEANQRQAEETEQMGTERWWSDPTVLVTNGPYEATAEEDGELTLTAAQRYYAGQSGPHTLTFRFADTAEEAWTFYETKAVDMVWPLTEAHMAELAGNENWNAVPELGTYTVVFNCVDEVLADNALRQAMALTIDRNALVQLAGVTAKPAGGLVPPGVPGDGEADFRTVSGPLLDSDPQRYAEDCFEAKELLGQAGYDSGASLGVMEYLYVDSGANAAVAQALCAMWRETLQIQVVPRAVTEEALWTALRADKYDLAGLQVTAPGNDAECFLRDWTTDSQDNVAHYSNSAYDTLMTIIAAAADNAARMGCLHDAEALLLEDYALAPLYNLGTAWELRDGYTGLCRDARGWFNFSSVTQRTA